MDGKHPVVRRRTIAFTKDEEDALETAVGEKHLYDDISSAVRAAVRYKFPKEEGG